MRSIRAAVAVLVLVSGAALLTPSATAAPSRAAVGAICPPGTLVCGIVMDSHGPVEGVHVSLVSLADPDVPFPVSPDASTTTAADGTWTLTPAIVGNPYTLRYVDPTRTHLDQSTTNQVFDPSSPRFLSATLVRVARVSGTIVSAATGLGIPMDVRLYDPATGKQVVGVTNHVYNGGGYDFGPLPAGRYQVRFGPGESTGNAPSYALQWGGGAPTAATSPVYDLQLGDSVVVDASMVVAGSISGTLTTHDGKPLTFGGTTVRLYDDANGGGVQGAHDQRLHLRPPGPGQLPRALRRWHLRGPGVVRSGRGSRLVDRGDRDRGFDERRRRQLPQLTARIDRPPETVSRRRASGSSPAWPDRRRTSRRRAGRRSGWRWR